MSSDHRIMELEESEAGQTQATRQLPNDLRDIVDKLEARLKKVELKIKESSVKKSAVPPYVPGSLPGKCFVGIVGIVITINESNEVISHQPQVEERASSPAGHITPVT